MYTVIDLETTGLNTKTCRIIEIAIFHVDGDKVEKKLSTLVNPKVFISPLIQRITGIKYYDAMKAPTFKEIASDVKKLFRGKVFVAHNSKYDYEVLRNEFYRNGIPFRRKHLCTLELSRVAFPNLGSYKLGNLCEQLGIDLTNAHRAEDDAHATAVLLQRTLAEAPF
jgi:DNA polymerase-3 subunit epsilon